MVQEPTFGILWSCQKETFDSSRSGIRKRSYWSGTDLRNSSELSKGAFRLVKKRTDEALLLVGNRPSEFFGAVKGSIPIGQETDGRSAPIGREPSFEILRSCQREHSDWSRSGPTKRSYWSGTDLRNSSELSKGAFRLVKKRTDEALLLVRNRPSEFFVAVKESIPIGQEADRRNAPIGREPTFEFFGAVKGSISTDQDAEFFGAYKRSVLIGRKPTNHDAEMVRTFLLILSNQHNEQLPH